MDMEGTATAIATEISTAMNTTTVKTSNQCMNMVIAMEEEAI